MTRQYYYHPKGAPALLFEDGEMYCGVVRVVPKPREPETVPAFTNGLTPAETERLALLAEEAGELVQACMKVLRHGYGSRWPEGSDVDNRYTLSEEAGHVRTAINLMTRAGDLDGDDVWNAQETKRVNIGRWLHHQGVTRG
jgi:NTP pyrophosphatase (non-canonical NTP hydrolase)